MTSTTDNRPNGLLSTAAAAARLTFVPQTLRRWAVTGRGPIQPVRVGKRRLLWRVADIDRLLGLGA